MQSYDVSQCRQAITFITYVFIHFMEYYFLKWLKTIFKNTIDNFSNYITYLCNRFCCIAQFFIKDHWHVGITVDWSYVFYLECVSHIFLGSVANVNRICSQIWSDTADLCGCDSCMEAATCDTVPTALAVHKISSISLERVTVTSRYT